MGTEDFQPVSLGGTAHTGDSESRQHTPSKRDKAKWDAAKAKIDLKTSFVEARDWPKFRAGYFQLIKYLSFIGLYFCILAIQMKVDDVFKMDEALRQTVVDEQGSLQDVSQLGDFFDYLSDQIMPKVFPDKWYNEKPLSTAKDETGYVLGYNKLVGGLLLTQQRGLLKSYCKEPYFKDFRSSYETFYPTCFVEGGGDIADFVNQSTRDKYPAGTPREHPEMRWTPETIDPPPPLKPGPSTPGWVTFVPWTLHVVKNPATNDSMVEELEPSPPKAVNDTRGDAKTKEYYTAFTYSIPSNTKRPHGTWGVWNDEDYGIYEPQLIDGGFRAFLKLSDGATFNQGKLDFLRKHLWLDKFTRKVSIKFAVYNGMLSMFTFVKIEFGFTTAGTFKQWNTLGGTNVQIKSINMEPYRLTQQHNCTSGWTPEKNATCYDQYSGDLEKLITCNKCAEGSDELQLALEVFFMIWVFYDIVSLLRNGLTHALRGWEDWQDPVMDDDIYPGFKSWLKDPWTWLDTLNYALFLHFIVIRISLMQMIVNEYNAVTVPINDYVISLEYASDITQKQLLVNFWNIVLCLLRTFKFYRFQPRLAIVNQTLFTAGQDLFHFCLMFATFILGFSVIGHILFGPELYLFHSVSESINAVYIMMLTASVNVAALSHVDGTMAVLFYFIFMFLVTVTLLNVLLAILVDSYMKAKEQEMEKWVAVGYDDLPNMFQQLFSFQTIRHLVIDPRGSIHEDMLLEALRAIKTAKEKELDCSLFEMDESQRIITVQDIWDVIPDDIRNRAKLTYDKIYRGSCLQFYHEHEEAEEEEDYGDFHEEEFPLDPVEETLYKRIQELIAENEMLHVQHSKYVHLGVLKHKSE